MLLGIMSFYSFAIAQLVNRTRIVHQIGSVIIGMVNAIQKCVVRSDRSFLGWRCYLIGPSVL